MSLKLTSNTLINTNINIAFKEYNNLLFTMENEFTNKTFTNPKMNLQITIDVLDFIQLLFSLLKHQSEFIAELLSTYQNISDTIPCKEQIISNLILANKETTNKKINSILTNSSIKSTVKINNNKNYNLSYLLISSDSFSILSTREEEKLFESFGNIQNNNSNNSSFTFSNNNNKLQSFNTNSDDNIDSYIKLSNDNVVSKIQSKINLNNRESYSKEINLKSLPAYLNYDQLYCNSRMKKNKGKSIEVSTEDKKVNEFKSNLMIATNFENSHFNSFDNENYEKIKENLYKNSSDFNKKPKLGKFINNTKMIRKNNRKQVKASTSCELKKNKIHLLESSFTSNTTSISMSSNTKYRQNTVTDENKSKITMVQNKNENAKKRTKKFYQNIKNVKSKYVNYIKDNNKSNFLWEFLKEMRLKTCNKRLNLEQYINSKYENPKKFQN